MCEPGRETWNWNSTQEALAQGNTQMPAARFVLSFTIAQSARIESTKTALGKGEDI
jgi:hypothetical protein